MLTELTEMELDLVAAADGRCGRHDHGKKHHDHKKDDDVLVVRFDDINITGDYADVGIVIGNQGRVVFDF